MTYYIKGGSKFNEANPTVWTALNLAGFPDSKYLDANWKQIDYENIIDNQDPFWLFGSVSGGAKEVEIGLYNDRRIKINTTGIYGWDGDSWEDLIGGGGAEGEWFKTITGITNDVIAEQVDDTLTISSANNRLTIVGNSETDTINFTLVEGNINHNALTNYAANRHFLQSEISITESQISDLDHLTEGEISLSNLLEKSHASLTNVTANQHIDNLTDIPTRNHNDLLNLNAGDAYEHITQAQKDELHVINPHTFTEIEEPATPDANKLKLWAEESQGHTVLRFAESSGAHIHTIGECMHVIGRNTSGAEIAKGKMVYYNGTTTGKHPNFSMAKADALATMPAIGITTDIVANNGYGKIMTMGRLTGLNTDAFLAGDILYVSGTVAGGITKTFPPHPLLDQQIGIVEVKHANTGIILIDVRTMQGRNDGTIRQSFSIGDGASGDVTLKFNGDVGNDGEIVYDVSEDEFDFNRNINVPNIITAGLVDGVDVSTLKDSFDALDYYTQAEVDAHNWVEADITDLDKYTQAEVDNHNWLEADITDLDKYSVAGADAAFEPKDTLHDDRYYTETEIGDKVFEQSAAFPGAPSEGDLHYDEDDDSLYRYNAEAEAWIEIGVGGGKGETFIPPIGWINMFSGVWVDNETIVGWYKCDGNNGTINLIDKFVRGGLVSGATGGSDDAVVVQHDHELFQSTGGATTTLLSNTVGVAGKSRALIESEGVSGVGKNIPVFHTLIYIQRIS